MEILSTIGRAEPSINYIDRPTVKVVVRDDDKILILNHGLLPGGGVDDSETDEQAIMRELQEELGVTVRSIKPIGIIIQYRNFLNKKYSIRGYEAALEASSGLTSPQDEGEAQFVEKWLTVGEALRLVLTSIEEAKQAPMDNDAVQGRLYNLMTTYTLLSKVVQRP